MGHKRDKMPRTLPHRDERRAFDDIESRHRSMTPGRRKKNTRRWCRGKVGQEHDFVFHREIKWHHRISSIEERCTRCGKRLWREGP